MIRTENLHQLIDSVTTTLNGPVKAGLGTKTSQEALAAVLAILNRFKSDLVDGDRIAMEVAPQWATIVETGGELLQTDPPLHSPIQHWSDIDSGVLSLQRNLSDDQRIGRIADGLKTDDPVTRNWMSDAADLMVKLSRDFEASFVAQDLVIEEERAEGPEANLKERVETYLLDRFPQLPGHPIMKFAVVGGGNSKLTALFTLAENDVLPRQLALRMDIPNAITEARLDTEWPILQRVHELGLPVPEPILFEPEAEHIGNAFILSEQVTNAEIAGSCFPEDRARYGSNMGPDFGREAAQLLARIHSSTLEREGDSGEILAETTKNIARQSAEWRSLEKPPFSLAVDLGISWMKANPLPLGRPVCLIHGDYAQHNIMVRYGHIHSLLDWELAKRGDPAEDLAEARMMLVDGCIEWDEFVREYLEAGGPAGAVDPHAIAYYGLSVYLKHGANQTRLRSAFFNGERTDLIAAICASHYQDRITLYQSLAFRDAMEVTNARR
ncbi:MAG: hypothetical protein CME88_03230 [Hirschia sp.]|nr:hypothetical protein [Hirschia sp.]MBF17371.1 hypothetical protein [Hirschia sp.]